MYFVCLGDLDSCLDILIHVAQRLRDSEDTSQEQLLTAAKKVTAALTKEVGCSSHVHDCTAYRFDVIIATHGCAGKCTRDVKQIAEILEGRLCPLFYATGEQWGRYRCKGFLFCCRQTSMQRSGFLP